MSTLSAIIVEDEEASRETLANYLKKYCPSVTLVGMAVDAASGVAAIAEHRPDIVFLDVEMPYGNAFDLLEQVGDIDFETVFVTAFSNYALKALNLSAAYYILKPISIDELITAVDRIQEQRKKSEGTFHTRVLIDNIRNANKQQHKVVLPLIDGFEVIEVRDIVRCQANDNFTDFHLTDGSKKVICRTLKFYEGLLADFDFLRVHKSHMVNLQHVRKYKKGKGGQLIMSNESVVDVSPANKKAVLDWF